ncbi:MAG: exonuclease SbcCD subunit D C-terminal domain-containing protein [Myxococcales bacterium]|nr:exonuclease SbcCD subunit D C-terminal domain-containing protein [Myxococcales bacterium]
MRLIHTSDWHLGHTLREQSRAEEHDAFLAWLLDQLDDADALLIAGDVFDSANPTSGAQRRFFRFLAEARRRRPRLDVVIIGGNHDSAARLDAPRPLLDHAGVRMVGGVPRRPDRSLDLDRLGVPLHGPDGQVAAWVAAVPFLRPSDLPRVEAGDPLVAGVEAVYRQVLDHLRAQRAPGQALLAMGHCYLADTALSEQSERKILGGNQHALPASLFPDDVAYVALGHLHLAQPVGRSGVRYSGSPLPLSMAEATYQHQVLQVDLDGPDLVAVTPLLAPRPVEILRLPEGGPLPVDAVLKRLGALPLRDPGAPHWQRPFLEVAVAVESSQPDLRARIEAALEGRSPRLVSLRVLRLREDSSLADALPRADLQSLDPEAVFERLWEARNSGPVPDRLRASFHELVDGLAARGD